MLLPHYPINWDAGQFALGQYFYDLNLHQPHPPGYFLFVMLAKFFTFLTRNPSYSLAIISLIAGILSIWLLYREVKRRSGQENVSLIAALLMVFNPTFIYYSITGLSYIFEPLAVLVLLNLYRFPLAFGLVLGILTGFRLSIILISLPIIIWQLWRWRKSANNIIFAGMGLLVGLVIWLIPFLYANGGLKATLVMILSQFITATNSPVRDLSESGFMLISLIYTLSLLIILPFFFKREDLPELKKPKNLILLITIIWLPVVYLFSHFGDTGYLLGLAPLLIIFCLPVISRLAATRNGKIILVAIIIFQAVIFFTNFDLLSHHKIRQLNYPTIRLHDQRLSIYEERIRKYEPDEVVVVMLRGQYYGPDDRLSSYQFDDARPLAPYIPQYAIHDFLGVPGTYYYIQGYQARKVDATVINIPSTTTKLLILGDFINPNSYPANLKLQAFQPEVSPYNYYLADISAVTQFEFMGFNFRR